LIKFNGRFIDIKYTSGLVFTLRRVGIRKFDWFPPRSCIKRPRFEINMIVRSVEVNNIEVLRERKKDG
jgi:hypothetical protein